MLNSQLLSLNSQLKERLVSKLPGLWIDRLPGGWFRKNKKESKRFKEKTRCQEQILIHYWKPVATSDTLRESGTLQWLLIFSWNAMVSISLTSKAASVNMPYVIERWPGGMLTNFPTIRKAVKKMTTIDKLTADGTYSNLSKREVLQISRQRAKLDKTLGSIADLTRLPSALFVIDVMKENIAVREANRLGIPVFGIVDTNSDPTNIDFVIPANDDATKSVEVILDACCAAMIEGLEERKAEKIDMEAAGEAPANKGKKKSAKARLDKSDEEAINAAKAAAFLKEDEEA